MGDMGLDGTDEGGDQEGDDVLTGLTGGVLTGDLSIGDRRCYFRLFY